MKPEKKHIDFTCKMASSLMRIYLRMLHDNRYKRNISSNSKLVNLVCTSHNRKDRCYCRMFSFVQSLKKLEIELKH